MGNIPVPVSEKLKELGQLVEKHPLYIPVPDLARFLGMDSDGLRASMEHGNCPFGLAWKQGANADLRGANLNYSCWPLWYGSQDVIVDKRIASYLEACFCRLICNDPEVQATQQAIKELANQFHRVDECGVIW